MDNRFSIPLGRIADSLDKIKHPERTSYRSGPGVFSDFNFKVWPSRGAMLTAIDMQERAGTTNAWKDFSKSRWVVSKQSNPVPSVATIRREVWVPAKIMVTKAGKILAKVAGKVAGKVTGKRNPSGDYDSWGKQDWAAAAFKAGRQFDAASSGVANARVVTYGFSKWFNSLPPGYPPRGKGVTKPYLLKSFREGMQWDLK